MFIACVSPLIKWDGVGREQLEDAWELVRQIIVLGNSGLGWRN
jgi:hypothetical protein